MDKTRNLAHRYDALPSAEFLEKPPSNLIIHNYHLIVDSQEKWKKFFHLSDQHLIIDTPGMLLDGNYAMLKANYFLSDRNLSFIYERGDSVKKVNCPTYSQMAAFFSISLLLFFQIRVQ